MRMRCACLLFAALIVPLLGPLGGGAGGIDKDKPATAPPISSGQVEVRFTNGSVVVMTLLQDKIEVVTEYGKLIVPPRDVRSIEFGIHATAEEVRKREEAIAHLGSSTHAERDAAVQDLIAMGPLAYLRLKGAVASTDMEVSRRAESTLKSIREKYPARLLRAREEDVVRTAEFSIVGRIVTPTLKAKADDFGDLELRPARLLAMRWLAADTRKEIVIDAPTYGTPGNAKWMPTGVRLEPHVAVRISAKGQVDLMPQQIGQHICGPDGIGGGARFGRKGGRALGMVQNNGQVGGELWGRIGDSGTTFFVGSRHTLTPKTGGQLQLLIAQSPWGCPTSGEYRVTVAAGPAPMDNEEDGDD